MPKLFGRKLSRRELLKYVGDVDQVGGLRRVVLNDGQGRGLEAIELRTGAGLEITVTPGRTLDILNASLGGIPLAWMSPAGPVHPSYTQPEGEEFLRAFSGGLLTTCGLSNIGNPCTDKGEELGLHGRIMGMPARNVNAAGRWIGNEYEMTIEGEVREYNLYSCYFRLHRCITARLGENRIVIEDAVENAMPRRVPHQILYHFNFGYPLMDAGTETRLRARKTYSMETGEQTRSKEWRRFPAPSARNAATVFIHEPLADTRGMARGAIVNRRANGGRGLAVAMRFSRQTLPWLIQWRNPVPIEYVHGLEPSNGWVMGRDLDRKAGRLLFMRPGEVRRYRIELDFLGGKDELSKIKI